ncbi:ABC transporter ATP-binding protein [Dactylosporangium sp. NPDC005572]|uniref:ABC transporter ATP-binding protein n=1 Tax=Dactylosporangium sp. NPDC005572 TaxID=3156889 RepID=UPI0033ABA8B2
MDGTEFDGRRPVRTVVRLLAPGKWRIALAVAAFVAKDSPVWLLPLLTADIIDVVVEHRPVADLWRAAAVLAVILLQNPPMHLLWVRQLSLVVRHLGTDLRSALAGRLQQLSIGFHTRSGPSLLQAKVVRDVEHVELMLQQVAQSGTSAVLTLAGALSLTALRVPQFVPLFVLVVPFTAVLVAMARRRSGARNAEFRRRVEDLSARVDEMAHLMPITRAHAVEQQAVHRLRVTVEQVRSAGVRLDQVNGRFGALSWVTYQLLGAACLVGAALAARTGFSPVSAGDVVLLSTYFAVLTNSVIGLLGLAPIVTRGLESIRSIGEVLSAPDLERNEGKRAVTRVGGAVTLENVGFRYPGAGPAALSGVSLDVRSGETIAMVGPSGSGKSTVLNLLIGFIRPTEGRILLDGVDMEDIDLRTYRRFVSVVPQDPVLFDGSVRDNVTYGLPGPTEDAVTAALRDANALEFVEQLPHGRDTVVGERGALLSGGQRQRLAIARALVRDPRVLLLDEATSALDSESEALVQQALARLMRGRTTFVVAHRLSTVRDADRVAVLAEGRLAELGTYDDLVARGGRLARLHRLQRA